MVKKRQEEVVKIRVRSMYDRIALGEYANTLPFGNRDGEKLGREDLFARKNAWREEEHRLTMKFRKDCADEFGVWGHPKEPKLWDIAWSEGHPSGYNEVWNYYQEMVELIK